MQKLSIRNFFENNWEYMVLWLVLIGLFYLLKPFFLLIFLTFLITYITKNIVNWGTARFKLNYGLATVIIFVLFVSLLVAVAAWVGPKLVTESNNVLTELTGTGEEDEMKTVEQFIDKVIIGVFGAEKGQNFIASQDHAAMLESFKDETVKAFKTVLPHVLVSLLNLIKFGWKMVIFLFLAIIFSFILVKDWQKIVHKMDELESSRIRTFYLGAMPHLIAFADILGKALRAQAIIAVCNTILTAFGLWFFNVPNIALLSTVVFLCGFIPVLGTFLSSIPILLFGIQAGGLPMALKLAVLIMAVHAFEAYVLNPKITANILHIHPILVLVLLLLGERFFGIWGLVVGVPIGYYLITVLMHKDENIAPESYNQHKAIQTNQPSGKK